MGQTEDALTTPFTVGIMPNCEAHTEFVFRAPVTGQFGNLGQKSVAPMTDAVSSNWTGDWGGRVHQHQDRQDVLGCSPSIGRR